MKSLSLYSVYPSLSRGDNQSIGSFINSGNLDFIWPLINAIEGIKYGFAQYKEIWVSKDDITLKQIEDGQLSLGLYSKEEFIEQKKNPRVHNSKRYEIQTDNELQFIYAPDLESAHQIAERLGISNYRIKPVKRLYRKEISE